MRSFSDQNNVSAVSDTSLSGQVEAKKVLAEIKQDGVVHKKEWAGLIRDKNEEFGLIDSNDYSGYIKKEWAEAAEKNPSEKQLSADQFKTWYANSFYPFVKVRPLFEVGRFEARMHVLLHSTVHFTVHIPCASCCAESLFAFVSLMVGTVSPSRYCFALLRIIFSWYPRLVVLCCLFMD